MCSAVVAQFEHRLILSAIGQKLSKQDLEEMLFICEAFISESTVEDVPSATVLFRELEHRILVGPGQYDFLKTILNSIGRVDLANKLPQPNQKQKVMVDAIVKKASTTSKRSMLLVVSDALRKKDVQKLAFLSSSKYSDGISLIEGFEDKGLISTDNYDYLTGKLGEIGRYDLSRLLATKGRSHS